MSARMLVSVITPSYNQASYLESCIQSVLAQNTHQGEDFGLEYLIIDGGSDDGSQEIITKYAPKLAWWVSEPDTGQADAINKGLSKAQGEIIAWLNSDDLYLPGSIANAVKLLQNDASLGMVFGDALSINTEGKPVNKWSFGNWGLAEFMGFRVICQPAVFIRRSILDQCGNLDPTYHLMLDHLLWLKIARLTPVQHVPHFWAAARNHPKAKNVAQAAKFGEEIFRIFDWMKAQPDLGLLVKQNQRKIEAGAYRLKARYLLDGGFSRSALKAYVNAVYRDPGYTLHHWHRIIYAFLHMLGAGRLAEYYYQIRLWYHPFQLDFPQLKDWPGIRYGSYD